ncbi:hypothetical protein [Pseudomonas sp. IT-P100]|uniref:hypothetical protein n=1 Tax=Pseudomonas sp. IT-P100 TaxID=3026452 RepID=UPI0039E0A4A4
MNEDQKDKSVVGWRKLREAPEIRMDVEEQLQALVIMVDELNRTGVIDGGEWR